MQHICKLKSSCPHTHIPHEWYQFQYQCLRDIKKQINKTKFEEWQYGTNMCEWCSYLIKTQQLSSGGNKIYHDHYEIFMIKLRGNFHSHFEFWLVHFTINKEKVLGHFLNQCNEKKKQIKKEYFKS